MTKQNEVRLLDELGMKPSYTIMETEEEQTLIDQTASGELTQGAIEDAFRQLKKPHSINIPAHHQYNIRRDPLFTEYTEEKVESGPIGRYMDVLVVVDEKLSNINDAPRNEVAAYVLTDKNQRQHAKILLAP